MTARRRRAVLGGTFDHFHSGHEALLLAGLAAGDELRVGVTTARYLRSHPKPFSGSVQPYGVRSRAVTRFLREHSDPSRFVATPLEDRWGGSVEPGVDVLVVSPDTRAGAKSVNRERRRRGLPPVRVRVVPFVLADDLLPLSSRRIRAGIVTATGERRTPMTVGVSTNAPRDVTWIRKMVSRWLPGIRVRVRLLRPLRLSPLPEMGHSFLADERSRLALRGHDLGVGIDHRGRSPVGRRVVVRDASGRWNAKRAGAGRPGRLSDEMEALFHARAQLRRSNQLTR